MHIYTLRACYYMAFIELVQCASVDVLCTDTALIVIVVCVVLIVIIIVIGGIIIIYRCTR